MAAAVERWPTNGRHDLDLLRQLMRKGARMASVATPDDELIVVNTHLSANRGGNWSRENAYVRIQRAELHHLAGRLAALDTGISAVLSTPSPIQDK